MLFAVPATAVVVNREEMNGQVHKPACSDFTQRFHSTHEGRPSVRDSTFDSRRSGDEYKKNYIAMYVWLSFAPVLRSSTSTRVPVITHEGPLPHLYHNLRNWLKSYVTFDTGTL